MSVTIRTIAKAAQVSPATVSRALSGKKDVAPQTRKRIIALAQQLGYQGKIQPAATDEKIPRHIAVVIPNQRVRFPRPPEHRRISWSFNHEVYTGIEELAHMDQCTAHIIIYSYEHYYSNDELPPSLLSADLQGYIVLGGLIPVVLRDFLLAVDKPVITVGTQIAPHIDAVMADNVGAMRECVRYLHQQNHKRIGFIGGARESRIDSEKLAGYLSGLIETGLPVDLELVREGSMQAQAGYEHGLFLLEKGVDAIMCSYDALAMGALRAANEKGIKVPEEVHIVGFGDEFNDESLAALLTTFRVPKTRMGRIAYQRLVERLRDPKTEPVRVVMPTSFVEALQLQRERIAEK